MTDQINSIQDQTLTFGGSNGFSLRSFSADQVVWNVPSSGSFDLYINNQYVRSSQQTDGIYERTLFFIKLYSSNSPAHIGFVYPSLNGGDAGGNYTSEWLVSWSTPVVDPDGENPPPDPEPEPEPENVPAPAGTVDVNTSTGVITGLEIMDGGEFVGDVVFEIVSDGRPMSPPDIADTLTQLPNGNFTVSSVSISDGGYGFSVGDIINIESDYYNYFGGTIRQGQLRVSSVNTNPQYNISPEAYQFELSAAYITPPPNIPDDRIQQLFDEGGTRSTLLLDSFYGSTPFEIRPTFTITDPDGTSNPQISGTTLVRAAAYNADTGAYLGDRGQFVTQAGEDELLVGEQTIVVISVIDESSPDATIIRDDWLAFREAYPNAYFYLLQPSGFTPDRLKIPQEFVDDTRAFGPFAVNRPFSNRSGASDWFVICNLSQYPAGTTVLTSIDDSGSMNIEDVDASYDICQEKIADAGMIGGDDYFFNMGGAERWAQTAPAELNRILSVRTGLRQRFSPFNESWETYFETPRDDRGWPIYEIVDINTAYSQYDVITLSNPLEISIKKGDALELGSFDDQESAPPAIDKGASSPVTGQVETTVVGPNGEVEYTLVLANGTRIPLDPSEVDGALEGVPEAIDPLEDGREFADVFIYEDAAISTTQIKVSKLQPLFIEEHRLRLQEAALYEKYLIDLQNYENGLIEDEPEFVLKPFMKTIFGIKRILPTNEFEANQWTDLIAYNQPTESEVKALYTYNIEFNVPSLNTPTFAREVDVTQYLYWNWQSVLDDGGPFEQAVTRTGET